MLTTYLVNDEACIRATISGLLASSNAEVRCFRTGDKFLRSVDVMAAGCLILKSNSGGTGMEALERLKALRSNIVAIVLTEFADVRQAVEALKSGAANVLEWPCDAEVLLTAVRRALAASSDLATSRATRDRIDALTPRERDVLLSLTRGCSNREIAAALGLSPRTVEMHRARMMKRLGTSSLSETLKVAYDAGINGESRPNWSAPPSSSYGLRR